MSTEGMVPSGDAASRRAPVESEVARREQRGVGPGVLTGPERAHSGMRHEPEGAHLGPLTAGDPHVSIPIAPAPTRGPLGHQPWVGFGVLLMVGIGWVLLSVAFGTVTSLLTIAVPSTFWLPVLLVTAAWWHGWPGSLTGSRPVGALVNLIMFAVASLVLTGIFQVILGKADFGAIVSSGGTFPTFPFLIPVAATAFVAMLQLTFVCDRWPFDKMKPLPAGFCALLLCWGVALLVYFTVCNWNSIPAPALAAMGLRNPSGPVNGLEFIGWLVCLVPYQVIVFQVWDGWPFRAYENKLTRLVTSNVFVVGAGWLTFFFLTHVLHWDVPTVIGALGVVAVAVNITSMAFEDYPFHHEKPGMARLGLLMNVLGMSFLTFFVLQAIGNALVSKWTNPPLNLWIGINSLNFIAPVVVAVYAIFGRWPLPAPPPPAHDDALVIDQLDELTRTVRGNAAAASSRDAAAGPA
jgi:hypothetical protein